MPSGPRRTMERRNKDQLVSAFPAEDTGEARRAAEEGAETLAAKRKAEKPSLWRTADGGSLRAGNLQAGIGTEARAPAVSLG